MIAALLVGISASPFGRAALRYGAVALAIILFLLSIRSAVERVGRLAERLEATEKANAIQRRMLEVAARRPRGRDELVDRLRDGGFEANGLAACPPVVEYSREFQVRAARELALLSDGAAVVEMMGDYSVMREQTRVCAGNLSL